MPNKLVAEGRFGLLDMDRAMYPIPNSVSVVPKTKSRKVIRAFIRKAIIKKEGLIGKSWTVKMTFDGPFGRNYKIWYRKPRRVVHSAYC